jgi:hypothetical protein
VNCQEIRTLLPELVEGVLAEPRRQDVEAHLPGCADCRSALAEAKKLDRFLRGAVPVPEPTADFWAKQEAGILKAAARPAAAPSARRGIPMIAWTLGIAALFLVVAGGIVLFRPAPPAPERETAREVPALPTREPSGKPLFPPRVSEPETPQPESAPIAIPPASNVVLPGDPEYVNRLTDEIVQVGLAETASDRVLGLIKAADGRMSELRVALAARTEVAAEDLASAFAMIYREGIPSVLSDRQAEAEDLDTARRVARKYAGLKAEALVKLVPEAPGRAKGAVEDALLATREIAGQ